MSGGPKTIHNGPTIGARRMGEARSKKTTPKKQVKIKSEPTIPAGTTSQVVEDVQLVQVQQDPVVVSSF